ncbi:hypothetical protein [Haloprofundus salinisoli]|uniref:hypothetical protein n=1 Tax=Haloprofundus salinisoli TaxID=2876193 RepID=UPI001CCAC3AC|nr:hypothetical protein [Haloprofundus salinisoli]
MISKVHRIISNINIISVVMIVLLLSLFAQYEVEFIASIPLVGLFIMALVTIRNSRSVYRNHEYVFLLFLAVSLYLLVVQPDYVTTVVGVVIAGFSIGVAAYLLFEKVNYKYFGFYTCVLVFAVGVYYLTISTFMGTLLCGFAVALMYQVYRTPTDRHSRLRKSS